ncbi:response regulator transcription factor [Gracilimonas tropica]|uniref:response regulator transcription factor n=1 Tax=Gracilimonas tropica TaxID=454600 RepID=UPI00036D4DEC|nr:response regulator transcription factor [Gracilimonas tropica]
MINIVIIEDNKYMREGWKTILDFEKDFCVIAEYDSCEKAFEEAEIEKAHVVLLDIQLPGILGTEGVKIIRERNPDVAVMMVTIHDDDERIFKALKNGAIGYLSKKISPEELIDAVRSAHNGGSPMSPNIARKVINSFHAGKNNSEIQLSDTESNVLQLLAEGCSYKGISKKVYLSVDGVRYHIRNIYNKLEVSNKSEAVAKALRDRLI